MTGRGHIYMESKLICWMVRGALIGGTLALIMTAIRLIVIGEP
jgi:hypothetical protein